MHEEMKEIRQPSLPQEINSPGSMKEEQNEVIERQRQLIEKQNRNFEQLRKEYREELVRIEGQRKRAEEEADKLRSAPPKKEVVYRYEQKCMTCQLRHYMEANRGAWRLIRFLTSLLAAGIICEIFQSQVFLRDLLELFQVIMVLMWELTIGAALSGHYLAQAIGWFDPDNGMVIAGQILQVALPILIFVGYALIGKFVVPKITKYFRETEKEDHVPRMIGLHVICIGVVIALCYAEFIPIYDGFRINSLSIPLVLYFIWFAVSKYYEGGWWFKGWDECTKSWW